MSKNLELMERTRKYLAESLLSRANNACKVPEVDVCLVCSETARPVWLKVVGRYGAGDKVRGGGGAGLWYRACVEVI